MARAIEGPRSTPAGPAALARQFASLVRSDPEAPLLHCGKRTIPRGHVLERAARLRARLGRPRPGRVIGLRAPNGPSFLGGLVACWEHGAAVLLLDPTVPKAALRRYLRAMGADRLVSAGSPDDPLRVEAVGSEARLVPQTSAVIKTTSGSTGRPRGVLVPARALAADSTALEDVMAIGDGDRVVAAVPMSFSYGLGSLAVPALLFGRELVVPDSDNPLGTLAALRAGRATVLPTVPAFVRGIVARPAGWTPPPSLRLVITAGAPIEGATARAFRERTGLAVHVFYGASECGGICYDRDGTAAERGTVGRPIPGVGVRLQDGGRVRVESPAVADGYVPDASPDLQAPVFVTGDVACFDAGELRLLGRIEELIHVGGTKFSPREVERVLHEAPGVAEAVVRAGPCGGPTAFVCLTDPQRTVADLLAHCRRHLAPHKVPRHVRVIAEIPRTARGKLDTAALQRIMTTGA